METGLAESHRRTHATHHQEDKAMRRIKSADTRQRRGCWYGTAAVLMVLGALASLPAFGGGDPTSSKYQAEGAQALERGDALDAISHYERAVEEGSHNVDIEAGLAASYASLGRPGLAREHAEKARALATKPAKRSVALLAAARAEWVAYALRPEVEWISEHLVVTWDAPTPRQNSSVDPGAALAELQPRATLAAIDSTLEHLLEDDATSAETEIRALLAYEENKAVDHAANDSERVQRIVECAKARSEADPVAVAELDTLPQKRKARPPRSGGIHGFGDRIVVDTIIQPDGRIGCVLPVTTSSPDLIRNVEKALRRWRFEPARVDGAPVSVRYRLVVSFVPR